MEMGMEWDYDAMERQFDFKKNVKRIHGSLSWSGWTVTK